jgi:hypothetical protein
VRTGKALCFGWILFFVPRENCVIPHSLFCAFYLDLVRIASVGLALYASTPHAAFAGGKAGTVGAAVPSFGPVLVTVFVKMRVPAWRF